MSFVPAQITDDVQKEVNRIWIEKPCIGVKDLMKALEALDLSSEITKQRVKTAKQAIPYRYVEPDSKDNDENDSISKNKLTISEEFVKRKIQERTSVRALRRYKEADKIMKGLTAMGIILNDETKTWTIGKKVTSDDHNRKHPTLTNEQIMAQQKTGVLCQFCNQYFASKNLVFRHLRDVSSSCGNAIFANGDKVPDAPSAIVKREKQEAAKALRRKKTGKAKQRSDPKATLWFGDLPISYTRMGGQYRRLRALLRSYLPRDVPRPWIKRVVRKAYRKGGKLSEDESENERGEYLGYAIVVFRDEAEATNVQTKLDGIEVEAKNVFPPDFDSSEIPSFVIRVKNVQHNENDTTEQSADNDDIMCGGQHPPLLDQLRPLSIPELQDRRQYIRNRMEKSGKAVVTETELGIEVDHDDRDSKKGSPGYEHDRFLDMTVALYNRLGARKEVFHKGRTIPESIRNNLLNLLQNVRWPATSDRKGLTSDHYLVLQTNVTNDPFYNDLRIGCRELMDWADPDYYYSGIAVTKNFVASPHIDERDQSFQYAVSLGDFEEGGELCVEGMGENEHGESVEFVNVVETRNRIIKVDGRNVHWVRTWKGGADRYSLIFYDTTKRHQTPIIQSGVDLSYADE